jgi:hypothetical protein
MLLRALRIVRLSLPVSTRWQTSEVLNRFVHMFPLREFYTNVSILQSTVPRDILHELRGASPLMASSKRCCPICAAILYGLFGPRCCYLIPSKHGRIYPCALPPGLPRTVRQEVLRKYDDILRDFVWEENKRSWSATSAETAAISPPTAPQPASASDLKKRH